MANPQPDKFLRISTEFFDALIKIRIPGEARQVFDFIIRKTWGFNKKEDRIPLSQFALATGLKKPTVMRALGKLKKMNIIVIKKDNTNEIKYSIYKDFDNWKPLSKKITVAKKDNMVLSKKIIRPLSKKIPSINKNNSIDNTINNNTETHVQEIFLHYCIVMKRDPKKYTLTPLRANKIVSMLKEGKTVNELKSVINTCAASKFHMGNNSSGAKYNDLIDNIFRSREKIEWWLAMAEETQKQYQKPQIEHLPDVNNPWLYKIVFEGKEYTVNLFNKENIACSCGAGTKTKDSCQHIIWAIDFKEGLR